MLKLLDYIKKFAFMNIAPGRTSGVPLGGVRAWAERALGGRSAHAQRDDGRGTSVALGRVTSVSLCARPTLSGTTSVGGPALLWS